MKYISIALAGAALVFAGVGCWRPSVSTENPRLSGRGDVLEDWGIEVRGGQSPLDGRLENCIADQCLEVVGLEYPVAELPDELQAALVKAIDSLYLVAATHAAGLGKHGAARPFVMVARAEEIHLTAVKALFDKYGLEVPENRYLGNIQPAETLAGSCLMSAEAEEANLKLYREDLLPAVVGRPDLERVLGSAVGASEQLHLQAFRDCAK